MSSTVPPPSNSELVRGGTEPVLALLAEISVSLKELNSILKDHTARLGRLEGQKPGCEEIPHDKDVEATRGEGEKVPMVELGVETPVRSHHPDDKHGKSSCHYSTYSRTLSCLNFPSLERSKYPRTIRFSTCTLVKYMVPEPSEHLQRVVIFRLKSGEAVRRVIARALMFIEDET